MLLLREKWAQHSFGITRLVRACGGKAELAVMMRGMLRALMQVCCLRRADTLGKEERGGCGGWSSGCDRAAPCVAVVSLPLVGPRSCVTCVAALSLGDGPAETLLWLSIWAQVLLAHGLSSLCAPGSSCGLVPAPTSCLPVLPAVITVRPELARRHEHHTVYGHCRVLVKEFQSASVNLALSLWKQIVFTCVQR